MLSRSLLMLEVSASCFFPKAVISHVLLVYTPSCLVYVPLLKVTAFVLVLVCIIDSLPLVSGIILFLWDDMEYTHIYLY
ncbi:hypothetical protein RSOLAG1IB_06165 [Rhizoctonia solani AG-1 IB]|uniref:Uncharacterized protein n=1 Tax=Thanatephorus cucumeris (strain AG1-IB / isolate 7/3/14) TaxID=1108050 RepID=A0A0B7F6N9_THACB|nr:hypothetical protein RSOLAG1IB_06165 [Rhizoctonia solani AG-1 IB]